MVAGQELVTVGTYKRLAVLLVLLGTLAGAAWAQTEKNSGSLRGQVTDPSGAVVVGAAVSVTAPNGQVQHSVSDKQGNYAVHGVPAGTVTVDVKAPGFAAYQMPNVIIPAGQTQQFDIALGIAVEKQQITVQSESPGPTVDVSPESNANAIIIKGEDLKALSDDPDELQSELQALAGPAAGPNGGEIYIDGFTGGQIPPKSSIREIRINQNPFSAEYDRLGYGRIEIFTKPGTEKTHGQIESRGNDSAFNSQNPILNANLAPGQTPISEPSYYSYNFNANISGPLSKYSSYFISTFVRENQNESVINATNPADLTSGPPYPTLHEAISNPSSRIDISPRFDISLGQSNTLTIRDEFYRSVATNAGLSALTLPTLANDTHGLENTLQVSDSLVLSKNLVDDIRFQYRRIRNQQVPLSLDPTVTVQGAFIEGGNSAGPSQDHQDDFELQNYFAGSVGKHSLNFGARLRSYRDANYAVTGENGAYIFAPDPTLGTTAIQNYLASPPTPQQYTVTQIHNAVARAILFDAALFYQDDWKVNQRFTFSYGVRWESQNRISDKDDWAPRVALAYALGKPKPNQKPKTVLRTGYGWFYQRFTVPNTLGSTQGVPYIIQAIHNNFPVDNETPNEEGFTVTDPSFYNPNQPGYLPGSGAAAAVTGYSVDPHFHAAIDMQGGFGIDRQLTKVMTANVTYLYSRGVHMYLTDNLSAAENLQQNYPSQLADILSGSYPSSMIQQPTQNNMQFESGGVYRQHQIITSVTARYTHFSIFAFYQFNDAHADTSGLGDVPSVAGHPGFDYGRANFDVHSRFVLLGNIMAPWQLSFAPFLSANSGTPYNITTGSDLTANNQFNARPTFAASCSQANAVSTPYGCLDSNPIAGEKIIPYNLGTGPSNVSLNLRVSKVFGFGPLIQGGGPAGQGGKGGGGRHGGGGLGPGGLSGNQAGHGPMNATTNHKYSLSFSVFAQNVLNHENLGTPNGTLTSPFFGKSQSLAGGFFGPSTAGNRSLFLSATFAF